MSLCIVCSPCVHSWNQSFLRVKIYLLLTQYSSTMYTLQPDRTALRILAGPGSSPHMHMLNGFVDTPLFRHFGTSSWHSFDAFVINLIGRPRKGPLIALLIVASSVAGLLVAVYATIRVHATARETPVKHCYQP